MGWLKEPRLKHSVVSFSVDTTHDLLGTALNGVAKLHLSGVRTALRTEVDFQLQKRLVNRPTATELEMRTRTRKKKAATGTTRTRIFGSSCFFLSSCLVVCASVFVCRCVRVCVCVRVCLFVG